MSNTFWSVTYDNKYGQDTAIYSSKENAYLGACCIIMQWIDEVHVDEDRAELKRLFLAGEYAEMVSLWGEYQCEFGNENLTVDKAGEIDAGIRDVEKLREVAAKPEEVEATP